jgi:hypothetical protein
MANTFELISKTEVGSGGAANIEFTSIPSTFTDLQLVVSLRSNDSRSMTWVNLQFNSASSNRSLKNLYGTGSSALSGSYTEMRFSGVNANTSTSNTFGSASLYIPNYAGSNYKSASGESVAETNATAADMGLEANLWSNTAAITSIKIIPGDGTAWLQYSSAYLYGIKNS